MPWETWLISWTSTQALRVQLLITDCAADFGENAPVVTDLGPNEVRYTRADPLQGSRSFDLALDPLRLERETRDGGIVWDYRTFRGQACEGDECYPLLLEAPVADDAFARNGWKTTELGECAMLVEDATTPGDKRRAAGAPGKATASVRVLFSGGTLYVEVTDDVFVTRGSVVDTLVMESISRDALPVDPTQKERLRMDGTLTDWSGHVHQVEVAAGPSTRRFALKDAWPTLHGLWRLSYEDTDDGRTLARGCRPAAM